MVVCAPPPLGAYQFRWLWDSLSSHCRHYRLNIPGGVWWGRVETRYVPFQDTSELVVSVRY